MNRPQGMGFSQRQNIPMTPGMHLGLSILAMPTEELRDLLRRESARNPFLHFSAEPPSRSARKSAPNLDSPITVATSSSLGARLRRRLANMNISHALYETAAYLTDELDERGYLPSGRHDIAAQLNLDPSLVGEAISAIQNCGIPGIGARSLNECLFLQLLHRGFSRDLSALVVGALEPLANADWDKATRILNVNTAKAQHLAAVVQQLSHAPALDLAVKTNVRLAADFRVTENHSQHHRVTLIEPFLSSITLQDAPPRLEQAILLDKGLQEQHRKRAQSFLSAIRFRNQTLLTVTEALVIAQSSFFQNSQSVPQSLRRKDLARQLGLHPSTVGRAISGRALEWNGHVFPLTWFFPASLGDDAGQNLSVLEIQQRISQLVKSETLGTSMSDEEIAAKLRNEGVDIARRTVAKYRKCLNIPSSHLRRRLTRRTMPLGKSLQGTPKPH